MNQKDHTILRMAQTIAQLQDQIAELELLLENKPSLLDTLKREPKPSQHKLAEIRERLQATNWADETPAELLDLRQYLHQS